MANEGLRQFTRREIQENKDNDKTLFILHDKVYDVKSFLNEHPGGEEVLLDHRGKDGSEDFDDVGHSKDAFELMTKYRVGELVASERSNKQPKKGWIAGYNSREPEKERYLQPPGLPFFLLVLGVLAVLAGVLYFKS